MIYIFNKIEPNLVTFPIEYDAPKGDDYKIEIRSNTNQKDWQLIYDGVCTTRDFYSITFNIDAKDIKDGEYTYQISTGGTIITFGLMAIGKIDLKNNGEKKKIEYNG